MSAYLSVDMFCSLKKREKGFEMLQTYVRFVGNMTNGKV